MDDLQPGAVIAIVRMDNEAPAMAARVLHKHGWRCDCGGAVYHVELESGLHGDFCASAIRRPN